MKSILSVIILIVNLTAIGISVSVHPQLKYYETLKLGDVRHNIVKRSAIIGDLKQHHRRDDTDDARKVSFKAMGRNFGLLLNTNKYLFSSQFRAYSIDSYGVKRPFHVDFDEFYHGTVNGAVNSSISAIIDSSGVMTAAINTDNDTYVIEPKWRFFPNHTSDDTDMLIYKSSDFRHSNGDATHANESIEFCDYIKVEDNNTNDNDNDNGHTRRKRDFDDGNPYADDDNFIPHATHCSLMLVADYSFYTAMGSENLKTTVNYLIHIVDRVNTIFNETEWKDEENQKGFKGMGFWIKEISVHTEPSADMFHYNHQRKWRVRDLLESFSKNIDNKYFCLTHLFTHRTFDNNVLGLAYVAESRKNSYGGICSPSYSLNNQLLYLNTGLTTTRNSFGQRLISRQSVLVTAHEFGHNWGSNHDPHSDECSPKGINGGSYLMYTYSVTGYESNNKFFSPCSKRSIRAVLLRKSQQCFTKPDKSYCGNFKVEDDEECDEGLLGRDHQSTGRCCNSECRLVAGADCSDENAPCCRDCKLLPAGAVCKESDPLNCKEETACDGSSAQCPESLPQLDGVECLDRGQCRNGKCISYCQTKDMISCMCDTIGTACFRCCRKLNGLNGTCAAVEPLEMLNDGTPCHFGFCEKGRCERHVQDFVERFWDIVEEININTFWKFIKDNIVLSFVLLSIPIWFIVAYVFNRFDDKIREKFLSNRTSAAAKYGAKQIRRQFSTRRTSLSSQQFTPHLIRNANTSDMQRVAQSSGRDSDIDDDGGFNDPRRNRFTFPMHAQRTTKQVKPFGTPVYYPPGYGS